MKNGKILIVTNSREIAVDQVCNYLSKLKTYFVRINTDFLYKDTNNISVFLDEEYQSGNIFFDQCGLTLSEIGVVWYRRPLYKQNGLCDQFEFVEGELSSFFWSFLSNLDVRWVNSPWVATRLLEHNKLHQMKVASSMGLLIPKTLISNNFNDILSFVSNLPNGAIVKTIHSKIIKMNEGQDFGIFAQPINTEMVKKFKKDFSISPVMIQEYIKKSIELRITVVGNRIFSCAIHSQDSKRTMHDWRRYDFENVKHEIYELPKNVEEKILKFTHYFKLNFAAIDMVLTPSGEYIFLEVNPSGQFGWIEKLTGMPIAESIANLLVEMSKDYYLNTQ